MAEHWLVIDDSSTIQRVIKLAFQGYDVTLVEADSFQEASREIMNVKPSLVIADAALGGVQGVQDYLALKAQALEVPFIILEGSYDNVDEEQFRTSGFRHFLKKPFDGAQLLQMTRLALGRALPYLGDSQAPSSAASIPVPPLPPSRSPRTILEEANQSLFDQDKVRPRQGFDLGFQEKLEPEEGDRQRHFEIPLASQSSSISQSSYLDDHSLPVSRFALSDESSLQKHPSRQPMPNPGNFDTTAQRTYDSRSREPLIPAANSQLSHMLEPLLREEIEKLVKLAVDDYCRKNFAAIARELIQRELDRLTQDRSRLLLE